MNDRIGFRNRLIISPPSFAFFFFYEKIIAPLLLLSIFSYYILQIEKFFINGKNSPQNGKNSRKDSNKTLFYRNKLARNKKERQQISKSAIFLLTTYISKVLLQNTYLYVQYSIDLDTYLQLILYSANQFHVHLSYFL